MKNYVVTGFTQKYWNYEGVSWLSSILNLAKYDPQQIIVFAFDLPKFVRNQMLDYGINVIKCKYEDNFRTATLKHICDYASQTNHNFAYWNIDAYFQKDISEVFQNQICVTNNPGFISAPAKEWKFINQIVNASSIMNTDVASCFYKYYKNKVHVLPDTYNFCDIAILKDIDHQLCYYEIPQKVIHVLPQMKSKIFDKKISFPDRYREMFYQLVSRSFSKKILLHNQL